MKYAILSETQTYIEDAIIAWEKLEVPGKDTHLLRDIRLNIGNSTMWQNYLFEGFFTNLTVQKRIGKVMKNIEYAYKVIQNLRNTK